jgi:hypothetical protein
LTVNSTLRPRNSSRANAYAAIEHDTRLPMIAPSTTIAEFTRYTSNDCANAVQPFG